MDLSGGNSKGSTARLSIMGAKTLKVEFEILGPVAGYLRVGFIARSFFIIILVIDKEVIKIKASLLAG